MKKITILVYLLASTVFGVNPTQSSVRIDASSTSIPTSFAGTNGYVALAHLSLINTVTLNNRGSNEVVGNCSSLTQTPPDDNSLQNFYVAPGESWTLVNFVPYGSLSFGKYCYIRSFSGTITTGIFVFSTTGQ